MQLTPYIIFKGICEEALNFYAGALGGAIGQISRYGDIPGGDTHGQDPKWIMHSRFTINGNVLFMAADGPSDAADSGMVSLSLNFTDAGSIQNVFSLVRIISSVEDGLNNPILLVRICLLSRCLAKVVDTFGVQ